MPLSTCYASLSSSIILVVVIGFASDNHSGSVNIGQARLRNTRADRKEKNLKHIMPTNQKFPSVTSV
jgi:hypothetical protein